MPSSSTPLARLPAVKLELPFWRPVNALVAGAARAAAAAGVAAADTWLDSWRRAKLVLLDAGMAMRLSPDDQRNMFGAWVCGGV